MEEEEEDGGMVEITMSLTSFLPLSRPPREGEDLILSNLPFLPPPLLLPISRSQEEREIRGGLSSSSSSSSPSFA